MVDAMLVYELYAIGRRNARLIAAIYCDVVTDQRGPHRRQGSRE